MRKSKLRKKNLRSILKRERRKKKKIRKTIGTADKSSNILSLLGKGKRRICRNRIV